MRNYYYYLASALVLTALGPSFTADLKADVSYYSTNPQVSRDPYVGRAYGASTYSSSTPSRSYQMPSYPYVGRAYGASTYSSSTPSRNYQTSSYPYVSRSYGASNYNYSTPTRGYQVSNYPYVSRSYGSSNYNYPTPYVRSYPYSGGGFYIPNNNPFPDDDSSSDLYHSYPSTTRFFQGSR